MTTTEETTETINLRRHYLPLTLQYAEMKEHAISILYGMIVVCTVSIVSIIEPDYHVYALTLAISLLLWRAIMVWYRHDRITRGR
jgi:hypothetical protein